MYLDTVRKLMSNEGGVGGLFPGDSATALLLARSPGSADEEACIDLLTTHEPAAENVLSVTVTESPDDRLALWTREVGDRIPKRTTIVDARTPVPSASSSSRTGSAARTPSITVETLAGDAELVDLGVTIARQVGAWASTREPTLICLHSLTALLSSFDRERVIGLVNALDELCVPGEVVAHHHMDPGAHDEETVAAFRPLYDAVIEHVPDHGWTASRAGSSSSVSPSFRDSTVPPGGSVRQPADVLETVPMPQSFDTVLDLLSTPRRRALLYHLKDRENEVIPFDELVDAVLERERAVPKRTSPDARTRVACSLDHVHLPALEDAGVVEYADGEIRYRPNPALESCLDYFEALELG